MATKKIYNKKIIARTVVNYIWMVDPDVSQTDINHVKSTFTNLLCSNLSMEDITDACRDLTGNTALVDEYIKILDCAKSEPLTDPKADIDNPNFIPPAERPGSKQKGRVWTRQEDRRLIYAVSQFGLGSWSQVARFVGAGRNRSTCSQRWCRVLDPGIKKDEWTKEEELNLCRLAKIHGTQNWSKVSHLLNNRSDVQCRYRYGQLEKTGKLAEYQAQIEEELKNIPAVNFPANPPRFFPINCGRFPNQILASLPKTMKLSLPKNFSPNFRQFLPNFSFPIIPPNTQPIEPMNQLGMNMPLQGMSSQSLNNHQNVENLENYQSSDISYNMSIHQNNQQNHIENNIEYQNQNQNDTSSEFNTNDNLIPSALGTVENETPKKTRRRISTEPNKSLDLSKLWRQQKREMNRELQREAQKKARKHQDMKNNRLEKQRQYQKKLQSEILVASMIVPDSTDLVQEDEMFGEEWDTLPGFPFDLDTP
ncbi:hypothetical protein TRFO_28402 [Tritrichomonas foetus]|uniref:Myb-like DNA-binding domain containing protein n=1 Tax=Tritrichomonas foetus TaxID=1144522 RepID=A0A1J4K3W2_9EUKA|nr:hypothetical protein TRFO_28402 [Tritrichomonas foetus]|eukprot:OHT04173.1 hypothetical protein TRFO_28402 [Tritrichomonas foetus]